MSHTLSATCPRCGEPVELESHTERHRVHNGLGMQTVGIDHYTEVIDASCHHIAELSDDEYDELIDQAASNERRSRNDYLASRYDERKDEDLL